MPDLFGGIVLFYYTSLHLDFFKYFFIFGGMAFGLAVGCSGRGMAFGLAVGCSGRGGSKTRRGGNGIAGKSGTAGSGTHGRKTLSHRMSPTAAKPHTGGSCELPGQKQQRTNCGPGMGVQMYKGGGGKAKG